MDKISRIYSLITVESPEKHAKRVITTAPFAPAAAFNEIQKIMGMPFKFLSRIVFKDSLTWNYYENPKSRSNKELTGMDHIMVANHYKDGSKMIAVYIDEGSNICPVVIGFTDVDGFLDMEITSSYQEALTKNKYESSLDENELAEMLTYAVDNFEKCFMPVGLLTT